MVWASKCARPCFSHINLTDFSWGVNCGVVPEVGGILTMACAVPTTVMARGVAVTGQLSGKGQRKVLNA
jgi:hypothetical protein